MQQKSIVWCIESNFFISDNPSDILILRNEFRIYGNIISFWNKFFYKKIYVIFSMEEILTGVEFGFIIIKKLNHINFHNLFLFSVKYFSSKIYDNFKIFKYVGKKISNLETKTENTIRLWRESIFLYSKKSNKNEYFKKNNEKKNSINTEKKIFLKDIINKLHLRNFIKFKIFRDLWKRGFIIACGFKFGGTYLIYAGEINHVHASASVLVIEKLFYNTPLDLISYGRVGTITKKRSIIACLLEDFSINYIGLKWNKYLP